MKPQKTRVYPTMSVVITPQYFTVDVKPFVTNDDLARVIYLMQENTDFWALLREVTSDVAEDIRIREGIKKGERND